MGKCLTRLQMHCKGLWERAALALPAAPWLHFPRNQLFQRKKGPALQEAWLREMGRKDMGRELKVQAESREVIFGLGFVKRC